MSGKHLKRDYSEYKDDLDRERAKIAQDLKHMERDNLNLSQRDASGDLSGYALHMADMATDNFDREFSLDLASNEQDLLNRIDTALLKFKEGAYGTCESCGKEISLKRLKAVPYAELCLKCKETEEKKKR